MCKVYLLSFDVIEGYLVSHVSLSEETLVTKPSGVCFVFAFIMFAMIAQ